MPFVEDPRTQLSDVGLQEVIELIVSVNTPLVAMPDHPSEESKAYILGLVPKGKKAYLHIFLAM